MDSLVNSTNNTPIESKKKANTEDITAIILCGGLGTRLHAVTQDKIPKPMVDITGHPFLQYLLDYLIEQGITQVVLAVGHHKQDIINYFGSQYRSLTISYSVEQIPLGTGGAIKNALDIIPESSNPVLVLNGDTFSEYSLYEMLSLLNSSPTSIVVGLKSMQDSSRYGLVDVNEEHIITGFKEKSVKAPGLINAGVYLMQREIDLQHLPNCFSFEKDFMEPNESNILMMAYFINGYFIDIGIPEDYKEAKNYFHNLEN